ncbi:unnamed protein product, partial [marine sediment metagenome]
NLANLYSTIHQYELSRNLHIFCKEIREGLFHKDNIVYGKDYLRSLNDKGVFHLDNKEFNQALEELTNSLGLSEKLSKEFEEKYYKKDKRITLYLTPYTEIISKTSDSLGLVYRGIGQYTKAKDFFNKAVQMGFTLDIIGPEFILNKSGINPKNLPPPK